MWTSGTERPPGTPDLSLCLVVGRRVGAWAPLGLLLCSLRGVLPGPGDAQSFPENPLSTLTPFKTRVGPCMKCTLA